MQARGCRAVCAPSHCVSQVLWSRGGVGVCIPSNCVSEVTRAEQLRCCLCPIKLCGPGQSCRGVLVLLVSNEIATQVIALGRLRCCLCPIKLCELGGPCPFQSTRCDSICIAWKLCGPSPFGRGVAALVISHSTVGAKPFQSTRCGANCASQVMPVDWLIC